MFDRKTLVTVVLASYALAIVSKLIPGLSPSAVASYVPSFGSAKDA